MLAKRTHIADGCLSLVQHQHKQKNSSVTVVVVLSIGVGSVRNLQSHCVFWTLSGSADDGWGEVSGRMNARVSVDTVSLMWLCPWN